MKEITKVEKFCYQELLNFEENGGAAEPVGNAQYYMVKLYNSSTEIRNKRNPHNIQYEQMAKLFGSHNFQDDYNDSFWWILEFDGKRWSVDTNIHEGSNVRLFFDEIGYRIYDKTFSKDAEDFCNTLFDLIQNGK